MSFTVTDLFCGAGGSSSGFEQVPGVVTRMAANHWKLAVETHNTNLPHADHDVADISQVDPRRYPSTDLLWASPECTNHSGAKGAARETGQLELFEEPLPDEAAERSRATMFDVLRFLEAMLLRGRPYKAFVVENVVEVRKWMFYDTWKAGLRAAGYCLHEVYLNSKFAHAFGDPAPQDRNRWYCLGHRDKYSCPDLNKWTRPQAWCPKCDQWVKAIQAWKNPDRPWGCHGARRQYTYRCPRHSCAGTEVHPPVLSAAHIIDWGLRGQRIGDRARPLAAKTMQRIEAGLRRFACVIPTPDLAQERAQGRIGTQYDVGGPPLLVPTGGSWNEEAAPVKAPLRTRLTREMEGLMVPPLLIPMEGREGKRAASADEPLRTQTTRNETGLALWPPLVIEMRGGGSYARPVTQPLATVCASGNHFWALNPLGAFIMRNNGSRGDGSEHCTPITESVRTITTRGHQSLVTAPWMIDDYNGLSRHVSQPLPAQTTVEGNALASLAIDPMDCEFRMLVDLEIQLAMAFDKAYTVLGNKRERVKQLGNAVTPPAARDLVAALTEAISGVALEVGIAA